MRNEKKRGGGNYIIATISMHMELYYGCVSEYVYVKACRYSSQMLFGVQGTGGGGGGQDEFLCSQAHVMHSYISERAGVEFMMLLRGSTSFFAKRGSRGVRDPSCGGGG